MRPVRASSWLLEGSDGFPGSVTSEDTYPCAEASCPRLSQLLQVIKVLRTFRGYPAELASGTRKGYASEGGYWNARRRHPAQECLFED